MASFIQAGAFSLPTPADWQIASIIVVGPQDGAEGAAQQFQQNIVVVSEPVEADETTETYVQKQTAKLKEQKALFASPGQLEKVALAAGQPAVLFEHVVLGPGGEHVRQMQVVTIHDGRMHALIASHLDGPRFAAHRASLRGILTRSDVRPGAFVLPTPGDWQIASIIAVGPQDGSQAGAQQFQQNIVVVSEPVEQDETSEAYVQKQTAKLKEQKALFASPGQLEKVSLEGGRAGVLFEHVVLGPGQPEKVSLEGGRAGVLFEHVVLGPGGEHVRQMQVVSLHEGRMHALIASHLDGPRFAAQRSNLRKILTGAKLP